MAPPQPHNSTFNPFEVMSIPPPKWVLENPPSNPTSVGTPPKSSSTGCLTVKVLRVWEAICLSGGLDLVVIVNLVGGGGKARAAMVQGWVTVIMV
uniref:Uncharacterized protein n=1 Tax=Fagus sylvatica TaxID=28930 RepID=A0A2N9I586_FAGSY